MKLVLFRAYGFYTFRDFIADGGLASYGIKFRRTTDKRRTASNSCGRSSEQCGDFAWCCLRHALGFLSVGEPFGCFCGSTGARTQFRTQHNALVSLAFGNLRLNRARQRCEPPIKGRIPLLVSYRPLRTRTLVAKPRPSGFSTPGGRALFSDGAVVGRIFPRDELLSLKVL